MRMKPTLRGRWRAGARALALLAQLLLPPLVSAQVLVDRIVARIENDIITLSDLRETERVQMLLEGKPETQDQILQRVIEQWIIRTEMDTAGFPEPSEEAVARAITRVQSRFASKEAFDARLAELRLTRQDVVRVMTAQLRALRYVDYKLRGVSQPGPEQVREYFERELIPALQKKGETLPEFDDVEPQIRELLTQRELTARAERWLQETKARLRIETMGGVKSP